MEVSPNSWAQPCLEHLAEWGLTHTGALEGRLEDGAPLAVTDGHRTWGFQLVHARYLRTNTVAHRASRILQDRASAGPDTPSLLFTEYVTPGVGEVLRELGICYVDVAGNAWVRGPGLLAWVEGKRRVSAPRTNPKPTTPGALQLVYLLLKDAHWCSRPYREMAEHTGLALGTIGWIMNTLIHSGHVARTSTGRVLKSPERLHAEWEEHWYDRLRPRLAPTTCIGKRDPGFERLMNSVSETQGCFIGGELGVTQLLGGVEPTTATIHVPPGSARDCMQALTLLPNRDGNIQLVETFGSENRWDAGRGTTPNSPSRPLADPLLLRAEVLSSNDQRLHLMAHELLTDYIMPRWVN